MLFILLPLLLVDAIASNSHFLLKYRIDILGAPINLMDALVGVGLVSAMLPIPRFRMHTQRLHPLFLRVLQLFAVGAIAGSFASLLSSDVDSYYFVTCLRNFLFIPAAAALGYWLIHQPKQVRQYCFWYVIAGLGAGFMIVLFFKGQGELVTKHDFDINKLRSMEYGPAIAGIAACFLLYQISSDRRQMPLFASVLLGSACFVGQAATLSRSDWVALLGTMISILFLLPRERRINKAIKFCFTALFLLMIVFPVGIFAASRLTGTDFQSRLQTRFDSLMPTERQTSKELKAWDGRLQAAAREVELWAHSPIIGQGFGHAGIYTDQGERMGAYGHNTWTFVLFQTGPFGFAGVLLVCVGSWIVGRRMILQADGDKTYLLMGGLGALSAVFFFFHGLTTASFNTPRPAVFYGLTFGVLMRARSMQLEQIRLKKELDDYTEQSRYVEDELQPPETFIDEPVFGNWYQPN